MIFNYYFGIYIYLFIIFLPARLLRSRNSNESAIIT